MIALLAPGCTWLVEVREPLDEVTVTGVVYDGPYAGSDTPLFTEGSMTWTALDGEPLAEGVQPYEDQPGTWSATLPVETEYVLRIEGEGHHPAIFRGRTADQPMIWYGGVLFGWPADEVDPLLDDVARSLDRTIGDLSDGEVVHLWGLPLDPAGFDPAEAEILDGAGVPAELLPFRVGEDGNWLVPEPGEEVDLFLAFDLAPGEIALRYGGEEIERWPTRGGDLVAAWWLEVP